MLYPLVLFAAQFVAPSHSGYDWSCPEYVQQAAVLTADEFSLETVRTLGLEFLRKHRGVPFGKLLLAKSADYLRYYSGKTDQSFDNWEYQLRFSEEHGWQPIQDIAEVDLISGNAIIRMRQGPEVVRILLTDHDPLKSFLQESQYEIINFAGKQFREVRGKSCLSDFTVFLRSRGSLNMAPIRRAGKVIRRLLPPDADIRLLARNDSWFISEPQFPAVYAFGDRGETVIPTRAQFHDSPEVSLFLRGKTRAQ